MNRRYFHIMFPGEFERRKERDLHLAKERLQKTNTKQNMLNAREVRLKQTENQRVQWEGPSKLLNLTKAAQLNRLTSEELDCAEHKRLSGSAHNSRVASGGYDLKFSGRAVPVWRKGIGH